MAPNARRIINLQYQGQRVDDNARFIVVTNNYRASGGDGFPGISPQNQAASSPHSRSRWGC